MSSCICFFFFFFFQAEDGIRDHCVTGVQTCALPILRRDDPPVPERIHDEAIPVTVELILRATPQCRAQLDGPRHRGVDVLDIDELERSEERRVGKEWRSRWATYG